MSARQQVRSAVGHEGRFWARAEPWVRMGFNVLPADEAGVPCVPPWHPTTGAALDEPAAPRVPAAVYRDWRSRFGHAEALILPASLGYTVFIAEDIKHARLLIMALKATGIEVEDARSSAGDVVHAWVAGLDCPTEYPIPGVMAVGRGGGILARSDGGETQVTCCESSGYRIGSGD